MRGKRDSSGIRVGITRREENDVSDGKSIPGFAKTLLFVQTVIILFMSFWIYQEYQNNPYLQSYVNGNLQAGSFTTIVFISISMCTIIAIGLFLKLRSTRRELEGVLSAGTIGRGGTRRGQAGDARAEEHLIEMIRKTTPIMNSGTGGPMPMLRRRDSQYSREEQGSSR